MRRAVCGAFRFETRNPVPNDRDFSSARTHDRKDSRESDRRKNCGRNQCLDCHEHLILLVDYRERFVAAVVVPPMAAKSFSFDAIAPQFDEDGSIRAVHVTPS